VSATTDEELLSAVKAGDTDSLGVLVARWEQPLFQFVCRMLPRQDDARDICQETFLRVLNKAHRFRQGSRFSTWMYQIALNLCRDRMRKRKRWSRLILQRDELPQQPSGPMAVLPRDQDPAHAVEQQEKNEAVRRALNQLPAEQREVLILKEYEGMKFREIAAILDCPESTVKSRMYYGLSGVRTILVRNGIQEP
jgi:RNA polymerase sigma-70 factor (ECF subfamily)